MADPNNLLIHEHKLCLMLVCKAANTSIKYALYRAMGLPETHHSDRQVDIATKQTALQHKGRGYLTLSVTRHPVGRLVSCWQDKVAGRFHKPFQRKYGEKVWPRMPFRQFAEFVAETPDEIADQHFRSMTWDLVQGEEIVPEVIPISNGWWQTLRGRIFNHCGLDIGPERRENRNGAAQPGKVPMSLIRERYAEDFEWFGYD